MAKRDRCWLGKTTPIMVAIALSVLMLAAGCVSEPTDYAYKITPSYGVDDPQFQRTMTDLLGPPILPGNTVSTLINGDEIFPAMLDAIQSAKHTITFETFVYWSGTTGAAFADALSKSAASGVHVHVLVDAVGSSRIDRGYIKQMQGAGVEVTLYHALKWFDVGSAKRINNRTHRKILVIDGTTGFIGGVGIADEWLGHAQDETHWRDNHYRVTGPVVAQLQGAFMDNWMEATGEVLHDEDYFPNLESTGTQFAQVFKSSYQGGSESMHLMYLLSMSAARKTIRLSTAYFVLDDLTAKTMLEARARGVSIQIIVPGPVMDEQLVRKASRSRWGKLLEAGVEIYEYQPTMYHCKLMIVDDFWTSIGSSNLDNRSFRLNCEANLNVLDGPFAAQQARVFENDLSHSQQVTYEQWKHRPLHEQFMEFMASLMGPQL